MQIQTYMSACKYSACDWEIEILFSAATLCQVDVYNQYQIEERERERVQASQLIFLVKIGKWFWAKGN